jgi:predicted DNA binding CopG/RHH family protein
MKLNKEEKELLNSLENDEWKSIDKLDEKKSELTKSAKETLRKDKRINIRLFSKDLDLIKLHASEEGIPYQTLISSILHKFAHKRIRV